MTADAPGTIGRPLPQTLQVSPTPATFRQQLRGAVPRLRRHARSLAFEEAQADGLVQSTREGALA
jgi:RNA polymerase sigma-70 factor (ECF subfamily)